MQDHGLEQTRAPTTGALPVGDEEAHRWPPLETLHSSLIGLTLAFMGFAPRLIPVLLAVVAVVTVIEVLRSGVSPAAVLTKVFQPVPMRAALALFLFAALSALWASDGRLALHSVVQVALVALATGTIVTLLPGHLAQLPLPRRVRFTRAVPMGLAAAVAFILLEFATGNAISLTMLSRFPALMGDNAKEFVREGEKILGLQPFYLNRNVAALTLALPAGLLATMAWLGSGTARRAAVALALAAVAALALSYSEAAKLAAAFGAIAAVAAVRWSATTSRVLMGMFAIGVLLALPLGHLPSKLGFETAAWLPPSVRERATIWDRTATAARRTFWLGIGVQSTRYQASEEVKHFQGLTGPRRELGWHAHNMVLQTWFEMGLAGALLLLGLGLAVLRAVAGMSERRRVAGVALFVMVLAVGLTGWGMWQPWLAAVIGTSIAALWVSDVADA